MGQVFVALVLGGTFAAGMGFAALRTGWLLVPAARFLRLGMWAPLVTYWALPTWMPWAVSFGQSFAFVSLCNSVVVGLSTLYEFLVARLLVQLPREDARSWLARVSVRQALLVSIYSQLWLQPYGWNWYAYGLYGAYLAFLIVFAMQLIEGALRISSPYIIRIRGEILIATVDHVNPGRLVGAIGIWVLLLLVWQAFSFSPLGDAFVAPLLVFEASYRLLRSYEFWLDLYVTFSEVIGGLGIAMVFVLFTVIVFRPFSKYFNAVASLLSMLHIPFLFSPVILMYWLGAIGYWQKTIAIGLFTCYPAFEAFWGLRDRVQLKRLLLAIDYCLPYALVMAVFSEAMAATSGVGFAIVKAHSRLNTVAESVAHAVILLLLFAVVSETTTLLLRNGNLNLAGLTRRRSDGFDQDSVRS